MVKLLLLGDLHFRSKNLEDIASAWGRAIRWAKRNGVDGVIQAGDVFSHYNVYGREASTGTIFSSFLEPLCDDGKPIPLLVIPGNHDIGSPRDKDSLAPIERLPWITVVRKPSAVAFLGVTVCAIPWVYKVHLVSKLEATGLPVQEASKKAEAAIRSIPPMLAAASKKAHGEGKFVLVLGHLDVAGAKLHGGYQATGSFEFSPAELASMEGDAYALGHIHVRQRIPRLPLEYDGYLGTLCQLDHGEEGNSVGCRLLELDGRTVISDRWLENKASPRYFTVEGSLEGLDFRPGIDRVKLRGTVRPDSLPEGVRFEPLPKAQQDSRKRTGLSADSGLQPLLAAWTEEDGCKVPVADLESAAMKLSGTAQARSEPIGSLERVRRLELKNITTHEATRIDLWDAPLVAVCGPNGSGKTTAMEALTVALYGATSKPSLSDLLPMRLAECESSIEAEFDSGGRTYIARREFRKGPKPSHKAFVFDASSGSPQCVAGPKIEDAESLCAKLVGDPALVLAGTFSSQGDADNLVRLRPAQRKDVLARMLGSDRFFALAEEAKRACATDGAAVSAGRARIAALKLELASEEGDLAELARLKGIAEGAKTAVAETQAAMEPVRAGISEMEGKRKERDATLAARDALVRKKATILSEGKVLKAERDRHSSLDEGAARRALEAARARHSECAAKEKEAMQSALLAEEAGGKTARAKEALSSAVWKRTIERSAYEREIAARRDSSRVQREAGRTPLQASLTVASLAFERAKFKELENGERAAGVASIPNAKECPECPLARAGITARSLAQGLADLVKKAAKDQEDSARKLAAFEAETDRILKEIVPVPEAEWEPEQAAAITVLEREAIACVSGASQRVQEAEALKTGSEALRTSLPPLEPLERAVLEASAAGTSIARLDALLKAKKTEFDKIEAETKALTIPQLDEKHAKELSDKLLALGQKATSASDSLSFASQAVGRQEAKAEAHAKRREEVSRTEKDIASKEGFVAVHEALAKAFSRDGIPQIVADSAVPHLEGIMRELLSECESRWSVRIATQRETKSGTVQERVDFLVDDGDGERDVSTYSGGELNLLSVVVRIAFAILQAERSGKGLKVLVLDEAMFFADDANSDAFMRMLTKLPGRFNQVFVVSHKDYVLSAIPDRIVFSLGSDGKTVVKTEKSGRTA